MIQLVWVRLVKAKEELVKAFSATTIIITIHYSDYSALGVETVETILMRILYLKNARSAFSFVTSKTLTLYSSY